MTEHKKDHHPVRVEQKFIPENGVGGSVGGLLLSMNSMMVRCDRGGDAQDER